MPKPIDLVNEHRGTDDGDGAGDVGDAGALGDASALGDVGNANEAIDAIDATEVFELVHAVMHLYRAQKMRASRSEPGAVTHMESKVLSYFARQPGATPSDLVAHAGRDKGQITRLVNGLRDRGLLHARADADDRRSVRLHLTAAGVEATRAVQLQARTMADAAIRHLSERERRTLLLLLGKLEAGLAPD